MPERAAAGPAAPALAAPAPRDALPGPAGRVVPRQQRDAFERLLRDKSGGIDQGDEQGAVPLEGPAALGNPPFTPFTSFTPLIAAPPPEAPLPAADGPAPAVGPSPTASATQVACAAALGAAAPLAPALAEAGAVWEVALRDPGGLPLELRATRVAAGEGAVLPAPWALAVAGQAPDLALLQRLAPRLDQRLRERGLLHGHVRIDGRDDEPGA